MSKYVIGNVQYQVIKGNIKKITFINSIADEVLIIPSKIGTQKITQISRFAFKKPIGVINYMEIPDTVEIVEEKAFSAIKIKKVRWSSNCKEIPAFCFFNTGIEEIENFSHVTCICESAFTGTKFKNFIWPQNCDEIPDYCFSNSELTTISNIENVSIIGDYAFSNTQIQKFLWPENCYSVPFGCFSRCKNLEEIYGTEHIIYFNEKAFESCMYLKKLIIGNDVKRISCTMLGSGSYYDIFKNLTIDFRYSSAFLEFENEFDEHFCQTQYGNVKIQFPYYC